MLAITRDNIAFIGKYQRNNLGDKVVFQTVLGILELGYRMHRQGALFKKFNRGCAVGFLQNPEATVPRRLSKTS